jgi:DNA (cytosine-5)-methyltransferase 1
VTTVDLATFRDDLGGQVPYDLRASYDLFAAGGGWDRGLELLGLDPRFLLGFEWSPVASTTARLAGYARFVADVARIDSGAVTEQIDGLIGSPPCQGFSMAGDGKGRRDLALMRWAIDEIGAGRDPRAEISAVTHDPRSVLVLEPLRWTLELKPRWAAWEQVKPVRPLWDACAEVLRRNGYSVYSGVLSAVQYDVPQFPRERAVVLASLDREVAKPAPVRSRYYPQNPMRLDPDLEPWLTIGDVLPHRRGQFVRSNYGTGGDPKRRGVRRWDQPAFTVTSKVNRNYWSDGTRVSSIEASLLQTFPADHPWFGSKTDVPQQIGDAVPPMLAAHCLAALGVGDLARARAVGLASHDLSASAA